MSINCCRFTSSAAGRFRRRLCRGTGLPQIADRRFIVAAGSLRDRGRLDIVTQAKIRRMPKLCIVGPLGELHLRDERGFHPVRALVRCAAVR